MKLTPREDYSLKSGLAVTALIAVLVAVSFIPPQRIGGVELRRANILSEVLLFDDAPAVQTEWVAEPDEELPAFDMDSLTDCIASADTLREELQLVYAWRPAAAAGEEREAENLADWAAGDSLRLVRQQDTLLRSPQLIPIEDFGSDRMEAFYDTLFRARRPVRIAFLGDSFVEGDILTADLRASLQQRYGGSGVGFAPMASPLTAFRRTVKTQSKGWTSYNIMQRKRTPAALRNAFYVSGWVCQPAAGASTLWEAASYGDRMALCSEARIFFVSPEKSRVELTLNDSLRHDFVIEGGAPVREILIEAPQIRSVAFRVAEGAQGFVGYGASFAGPGVSVDNYSVRSNNGRALFWTNPSVDAQIDAFLRYDLVILQYGLNIMQQGVYRYDNYAAQLEQMIAFVRECFPGAAVLVLGVSDRSVKTEHGFEPMDAIASLTDAQRGAARRTGAAFWPTADAMRSWGGMAAFVANGWAGKDYTHINYAGGRRVAWSLADAFHSGAGRAAARLQTEEMNDRVFVENLLDSVQLEHLRQRLLLPAVWQEGISD